MKAIKKLMLPLCLTAMFQANAQSDSASFRQLEFNAGPNYVLNIKQIDHTLSHQFPGLEIAVDYKQRDKNVFIFVGEVYYRMNNGDPNRMLAVFVGNDSSAVLGNYGSLGINAGTEGRMVSNHNDFFYGAGVGVNMIMLPEELYFGFDETGPPDIAQGYPQNVAALNGKLYFGYEYLVTPKTVFGIKANARLELPLERRIVHVYHDSTSFETDIRNEMILSFYPQLYYAFRF